MVGRGVRLTPQVARDAAGPVSYRAPLSSEGLRVSFDAKISGGSGADGLTLTLANPAAGATVSSVGTAGGGLGWSSVPGCAIALDTYQNGRDPSANFVGVATGWQPNRPHALQWAATSVAVLEEYHPPRGGGRHRWGAEGCH